MRVSYDEMKRVFSSILEKKGFSPSDAERAASIFAMNSLSGVASHGLNRFPRVIRYIDDGDIDVRSRPETVFSSLFFERWDCHMGLGPLNAYSAMERALSMADEYGIGIVALRNNNHWMRGGSYAEYAASVGKIGICWSNTKPNMPSWGAKDKRIGNNPLCIAVPVKDSPAFLLDMAVSQYSYGKLESLRLAGKKLPYPGGFDSSGNLTDDPGKIEETERILPIGYWKGSGLSIALDLIVSILSGGNAVKDIAEFRNEVGLSQILIALSPERLGIDDSRQTALSILSYVRAGEPAEGFSSITYPGQMLAERRKENLEKGIEVVDSIWTEVLSFLKEE